MKTMQHLESALERVGRILSRKYNITVRCKGRECKTDGRTIWLPALPHDLSDSLWNLIRGELDHETAHILYSNFEGEMIEFRNKWGDFGFDLLNVIEDVRVNYAMSKEYPGSWENIAHSIDLISQEHPISSMNFQARFLCGLFLSGMGLPNDQYGQDAVDLVNCFRMEVKTFKSLKSTEEACRTAESILQRLASKKQQSQKPSPQNETKSQPTNGTGPSAMQDHNDQSEDEGGSGDGNESAETDQSRENSNSESNAQKGVTESQEKQHESADKEEVRETEADEMSDDGKDEMNDTPDNSAELSGNKEMDSRQKENNDSEDGHNQNAKSSNIPSGPKEEKESDSIDGKENTPLHEENETETNNIASNPSNSTPDTVANNSVDPVSDDPENSENGISTSDESDALSQELASQLLDGSESPQGNPFEMARAIRQKVQAECVDGVDLVYRVFDPALDRLEIPESDGNVETYRNLLAKVKPHIGALRQQLIRTLKARDARFWVDDQEEGRISSRKLYNLLATDSPKVFRQNKTCETDSVAITLLVDLSGSMGNGRIVLTRQIAILFAETLNQLRIPSEVIGFTTQNLYEFRQQLVTEKLSDQGDLAMQYARFVPVVYTLFKGFQEPFKVLKERLPFMLASWHTPLDESVYFAAKRLALRPERRKIILALTDGEPYCGNPSMQRAVELHLEQNLDRVTDAGIECVAIGIQTDYVQRFFDEYIVVYNLAELPRAFYSKFTELLRRPKS